MILPHGTTRRQQVFAKCGSIRPTPAINKYKASTKGHTIELDALLDMLEVRLISIKPV